MKLDQAHDSVVLHAAIFVFCPLIQEFYLFNLVNLPSSVEIICSSWTAKMYTKVRVFVVNIKCHVRWSIINKSTLFSF